MKKFILPIPAMLIAAVAASGQVPAAYNTFSGVVWIDADSNNVRSQAEPRMPGVLVTLLRASDDSLIASSLSDGSGSFILRNFAGAGTYYINYVFPGAGYVPVTARAGTADELNSAADSTTVGLIDDNTVSTPAFTIASNADLDIFGLGLHRIPTTLTYWAFQPMSATSWSRTFRLPKSNNNTALANRATILINQASLHPTIGFENTGASPDVGSVEGASRLTITLPAGSIPQIATSVVKNVGFASYDGITDYDGTSGRTWDSSYGAAHGTANIANATQLTNGYRSTIATDSISINALAVSATTITGSANLQASVSTISGAGTFVTYNYLTVVPLPITLLSFTAQRDGANAELLWRARSTAASDAFIVERSDDGIHFTSIGEVAVRTDASAKGNNYSFLDTRAGAGRRYYRLRMTAAGSEQAFSQIIAVQFGSATTGSAYPNPAAASLTVRAASTTNIELLDPLGRRANVTIVRNDVTSELNVSQLPDGVYTLRLTEADGSDSRTERIIVHHR